MTRTYHHVEPCEVRWDNKRTTHVAYLIGPNREMFAKARAREWALYGNGAITGGYFPAKSLEDAKEKALASLRRRGLCCWFAGEPSRAFEGEWKQIVPAFAGGWSYITNDDGQDVAKARADQWSVWGRADQHVLGARSCLASGKAESLEDAKAQALAAAKEHGYRITMKPEVESFEASWEEDGYGEFSIAAPDGDLVCRVYKSPHGFAWMAWTREDSYAAKIGGASTTEEAKEEALEAARSLGRHVTVKPETHPEMVFEAGWEWGSGETWGLRDAKGNWTVEVSPSRWSLWSNVNGRPIAPLAKGDASSIDDAKAKALAAAEESGFRITLLDTIGGVASAFETRWEKDGRLSTLSAPCGRAVVTVMEECGVHRWRVYIDDSGWPYKTGACRDMAEAKCHAAKALTDCGYRITITEPVKEEKVPFKIEPWTYWVYQDGSRLLYVVTGLGSVYCRSISDGDAEWFSSSRGGLTSGAELVENPPYRHPNDPTAKVEKAKALIEEIGEDAFRKALGCE